MEGGGDWHRQLRAAVGGTGRDHRREADMKDSTRPARGGVARIGARRRIGVISRARDPGSRRAGLLVGAVFGPDNSHVAALIERAVVGGQASDGSLSERGDCRENADK